MLQEGFNFKSLPVLISEFQRINGFRKVGHKGFAVVTALWNFSSSREWTEEVEVYNKDLVHLAALRSTTELSYIRQKLEKHGFLKEYIGPGQGSREASVYLLNLNFFKT